MNAVTEMHYVAGQIVMGIIVGSLVIGQTQDVLRFFVVQIKKLIKKLRK